MKFAGIKKRTANHLISHMRISETLAGVYIHEDGEVWIEGTLKGTEIIISQNGDVTKMTTGGMPQDLKDYIIGLERFGPLTEA